MQEEISSLHRVIEEATLTKAELEEQMENMRVELRSLETNHEQVHIQTPTEPTVRSQRTPSLIS